MKKLRLIVLLIVSMCGACKLQTQKTKVTVVVDSETDTREILAAKELKRYLYLLTDTLPQIVNPNVKQQTDHIISIGSIDQDHIREVASKWNILDKLEALGKQEYLIKTINSGNKSHTLIAGGDSQGTLYGAYDFLEKQGVWFDLYGDVIPDEKRANVFENTQRTGRPIFEKRGLQPFHDFPEGPDFWDAETYQGVISQMVKMRMNFLGFHTYPEGWVNAQAEPTVWIGLPEDINEDGTVQFSYPSTFANTERKHMPPLTGQLPWFYAPMPTSEFVAGASQLFDRDDYGADFLNAHFPMPDTPEAMNEVFNNTGKMLNAAFTLAKELGIKTAVGTEIPLTIPLRVKERMKAKGIDPESDQGLKILYEGIFKRIELQHPLDYYWFWTSESWLWEGYAGEQQKEAIRQLKLAREVWDEMKPGFKLATCGWTLGPPQSPTAFQELLPDGSAMASINLSLGFAPLSPDFSRVQSIDTWAIPWLEDDPALCNAQLWVGRVRRDAADARHYGSEGLMGIHWRTRELSPQLSAMAKAGWDQNNWNPYLTDTTLASKVPGKSGLPRDLSSDDFYRNWVKAMFGEECISELTDLFVSLDGGNGTVGQSNIPRPTNWDLGPGGVQITVKTQKELDTTYSYVEKMKLLRNRIKGKGNLERFDFWLNSFKCSKAIANTGLLRHQLNQKMEKCKLLNTEESKEVFIKDSVLPVRKALSRQWESLITQEIERASAYDVIGTICNLEQHSRKSKQFLYAHDSVITSTLGGKLPPEIQLSKVYTGVPKIIVPTVRSVVNEGEKVNLKVIVMASDAPSSSVVSYRGFDDGVYSKIQLEHKNRGVYQAELPAIEGNGIEYYVEVKLTSGETIRWPATAPETNQTIIGI